MAIRAVKKVVKAAKPKRGRPKGSKNKVKVERQPKPKVTAKQIHEIIAETLQANSEGEFDVPSVMVRYLDKSHPKHKLGLHREYYLPAGANIPFYPPTSSRAMDLFRNQASMVLPALIGEGVTVREKEFDPPFCDEHNV